MVLLTGANGHLGANLLRRLLREGVEVRVLLRSSSDNSTLDGLSVERVFGDLRDVASVRRAVRGCSQIYHAAALVSTVDRNRQEIYETNVLGTRNILSAAREQGAEKVVVSGSLSATGHTGETPCDETAPFNPFEKHLPYAMSKAFVEQECLKAHADGLQVTIAVSCAILGGWDFKPSRMGRVLIDFADRRLRAYIPGGFEFVAADDIAEGHILAMRKGRSGQKYIFRTQFVTVDQLMDMYACVTGQPKPLLRLPAGLMAGFAHASSFVLDHFFPNVPQRLNSAAIRLLQMHRRASSAKAASELGYQPGNIAAAIGQAYDWFVDRGKIRTAAGIAQHARARG
jgi:nucleoside-diphosphate-sugar epimerase